MENKLDYEGRYNNLEEILLNPSNKTNKNFNLNSHINKTWSNSSYLDNKYDIEIISKKKKLYKSTLIINCQNKNIEIITQKDNLTILINFLDLLALIPFDEENKEKLIKSLEGDKINIENEKEINHMNSVDKNSQNNSRFLDCQFAYLNFMPKFTIRSCTCCGWICCKCKEIIL
jgi:hypothetical protein